MRYLLTLIALSCIGLALYGEFAFFHDYAWEDDTSWFFFLLSTVAVCLLCKANFRVNLVATIFSCFCILSSVWVLFSSLLIEVYYYDLDTITTFQVYCSLIGYFSLLLTKTVPLLFLTGICFCLRFKFVPLPCIPFLISGGLVGWLDGWDYRTFVFSFSLVVVFCSFATILDEWWTRKSKRKIPDEVQPAVHSSSSPVGSSLQGSKDQVGEASLTDDFSPPPCI